MTQTHLILAEVHTQDPARPRAEAVLVRGERIEAVGSREELQARAPGAKLHDRRDELLTPGLCDAHIHLVQYGKSLGEVDVRGLRSVAEVIERVRERAQATPPGEWIVGSGYLHSELGAPELLATDLDAATTAHPVFLYSRDVHSGWVNGEALRRAGIGEHTPDPEGGRVVRPYGLLLEHAMGLATRHFPQAGEADYRRWALAGARDLHARGYASAHTMAFEAPGSLEAVRALAESGELPLRIWAALPHERLSEAELPASNPRFTLGGVKFFADGALGSRTAWLHGVYADGSGSGMGLDSPALILERGRQAIERGLTPVTHAIGDRAITEVLDVYDTLRPEAEARGIRLRIEHVQHPRPEDLPRLRGLTASIQPMHLLADAPMIRALLPGLENSSYPLRSLLDHGALLVLGSDAPVTPPSVQDNFRAACTRLDERGDALGLAEAMDPQEFLAAHTLGPALAAGWDDEGRIAPGYRAALTLWEHLGGEARPLVLGE